jgi:hypothetical protein
MLPCTCAWLKHGFLCVAKCKHLCKRPQCHATHVHTSRQAHEIPASPTAVADKTGMRAVGLHTRSVHSSSCNDNFNLSSSADLALPTAASRSLRIDDTCSCVACSLRACCSCNCCEFGETLRHSQHQSHHDTGIYGAKRSLRTPSKGVHVPQVSKRANERNACPITGFSRSRKSDRRGEQRSTGTRKGMDTMTRDHVSNAPG